MSAAHFLTVEREWPEAEDFIYEIAHPSSCSRSEGWPDDAPHYDCGVQYEEDNMGIFDSLAYSGTPVTETGYYLIEFWHEQTTGGPWGPPEHTTGVGVLDGCSMPCVPRPAPTPNQETT